MKAIDPNSVQVIEAPTSGGPMYAITGRNKVTRAQLQEKFGRPSPGGAWYLNPDQYRDFRNSVLQPIPLPAGAKPAEGVAKGQDKATARHVYQQTDGQSVEAVMLMTDEQAKAANALIPQGNPWYWARDPKAEKAANAHDALVAAVERVVVNGLDIDGSSCVSISREDFNDLCAALKLAGEG